MANTSADAKFVSNLGKLGRVLSGPTPKTKADLCKTYAKIRPILLAILPILEKIPIFGKLAKAIRLLMSIADALCGV